MLKKCPVCGRSHLNPWGLIGGVSLISGSLLFHWGRQFKVTKGGPYITPETHPVGYWATTIGMALLGLAFIVVTLVSFFRDRHRE
jgi:hypothetical protein